MTASTSPATEAIPRPPNTHGRIRSVSPLPDGVPDAAQSTRAPKPREPARRAMPTAVRQLALRRVAIRLCHPLGSQLWSGQHIPPLAFPITSNSSVGRPRRRRSLSTALPPVARGGRGSPSSPSRGPACPQNAPGRQHGAFLKARGKKVPPLRAAEPGSAHDGVPRGRTGPRCSPHRR